MEAMFTRRQLGGGLGTLALVSLAASLNNLSDTTQADHDWGWGLMAFAITLLAGAAFFLITGRGERGAPSARVDHAAQSASGNKARAGGGGSAFAGNQIIYNFPDLTAITDQSKPNVVFDGYSPVRYQNVHPANISEDKRAEFARLRFVNEPQVKGAAANIIDLHATIEIREAGKLLLRVEDGRWSDNVDGGRAPGKDTKSTSLPCNGETRNLDIVMQRLGQDECFGWSHDGSKIKDPPIPPGIYEVTVWLDATNMERRAFVFELLNHGTQEHLELREVADNFASTNWMNERPPTTPITSIKVAPSFVSNAKPLGGANLVSELTAYLDVSPMSVSPMSKDAMLRNCRVKLVNLEHLTVWTERAKSGAGTLVRNWGRDTFYSGQTHFFVWSGRPATVEAVDIHTRERAVIANCVNGVTRWTTTTGAIGHMFAGDEYRIDIEVSADDARPLIQSYWVRMDDNGSGPAIEEWDASSR